MALNFRITEEYCILALELERLGYAWQPRAGDWMIDRDDSSIGMLTVPPRQPERICALNVHLPTYLQVNHLLDAKRVTLKSGAGHVEFISSGGKSLLVAAAAEFEADQGTFALRALVACYRESS